MKKKLVIVESPAKAKTLGRILGSEYILKASLGHIRDLPRSKLGVDVENNFEPSYVVPRLKSKLVKELKEAAKDAPAVFLATDPDREGEAISWHLQQVMKTNKTPYKRVVFHEITEEAINQAFEHPRSIDMDLVNAQQARRILDRLVGYKISPFLWRKIKRGLSAGRVQSVALRIIVDREREIQKFVPLEYWTIEAELSKKPAKKPTFRASLVGPMDGGKMEIHKQAEADELKTQLELADYKVYKVATKKVTRQPAPPFITSSLQQEAWRRLHFAAAHTMAIAQQLYEGLNIGTEGSQGLITYMRTDSTKVARVALAETREYIQEKYGKEYLPEHARSFTQIVKGAQEAHEAIRPTKIHREPVGVKSFLTGDQFKLYDLIWKRMVASQMAAALFDNTSVDIEAKAKGAKDYMFRTSSSINTFQGFIILYTEAKDQEEDEKSAVLPALIKGDALLLHGLFPDQHFTQPPPRFTEATLIKMLEQNGIGRPSTYAPTISTIQDREYVTKTGGSLKPTDLGFVVNDMVSEQFPDIVNIDFTAKMEDELDEIANNKREWESVIRDFYGPFEKSLASAAENVTRVKLPEEVTDEKCPKCGKPMLVKQGRFGKFLACSGYPDCKTTKSFQIKTGVKCPQCGSELIQRMSKKKRIFYGCSGYPNCKFAINLKPLPEPCPKCGGMLTLYKDKYVKCSKCDYKEKYQPEASEPLAAAAGKSKT